MIDHELIEVGDRVDLIYDALEGCEDALNYRQRHQTYSLNILTQHSPAIARAFAERLKPQIQNKRVIEIGAGVGFLAIEMARHAREVFAIESDPAWSWCFTRSLYRHKPHNLTWIFGAAQSVFRDIKGDVVVVCTKSDVDGLMGIAKFMAPIVVMPFQDPAFADLDTEHGDDEIAAMILKSMKRGDE